MINREIKADKVNVVNAENKGLTLMSLDDAIALAEQTEEDVILVNDKGDIPIVKIGDYSKLLYEKQKREKENKKKARLNSQETKEIQIGDATAEHDLMVKAKHIDRILTEGDKVQISIKYKGRSVRFIDEGPSKLQNLANMITAAYKVEKTPRIEGNKVSMIVAPVKK